MGKYDSKLSKASGEKPEKLADNIRKLASKEGFFDIELTAPPKIHALFRFDYKKNQPNHQNIFCEIAKNGQEFTITNFIRFAPGHLEKLRDMKKIPALVKEIFKMCAIGNYRHALHLNPALNNDKHPPGFGFAKRMNAKNITLATLSNEVMRLGTLCEYFGLFVGIDLLNIDSPTGANSQYQKSNSKDNFYT